MPFRIYQLETTNYCNASCSYCPHKQMTRKMGYVDPFVVRAVIAQCKQEGQNYIALHHMGEPLLHPAINSIIHEFAMADIKTEFSTNGLLLPKRGEIVLQAGLHTLRIAVDNYYTRPGYIKGIQDFLTIADNYNTNIHIHTVLGNDLKIFEGHKNVKLEHKNFDNWAGAVDGESTLEKGNECYFLKYNYVVVLWNGDIVPCCMDYNGDYVMGNIVTTKDIQNSKVDLCSGCAQLQFASDGLWEK